MADFQEVISLNIHVRDLGVVEYVERKTYIGLEIGPYLETHSKVFTIECVVKYIRPNSYVL